MDLSMISNARSLEELESIRIQYLGKQGSITLQLKSLGSMSPEERKTKGVEINQLRSRFQEAFNVRKADLEKIELDQKLSSEWADITIPPREHTPKGTRHPLIQTMEHIKTYFQHLGFDIKEGPEIEDDFHNFDALNISAHHPARQNHDTFFLKDFDLLLRTHTSTVQIRTMKNEKPPYRILSVGKVFRSDHDATHSPMFHQVEGLVLEKNIHMGHLKGCLNDFCRHFFDIQDLPTRFRPSFFPFTEPSAEVDIQFNKKTGKIGEGDDWLEVLGCGMVHPKVIENCGLDPSEYSGFAFGMGVERFTMLKFGINDLRNFFTNDARFLKHYHT